jgi:D-serine deaminase-like pyridoxal phosphate-dependent protein
MSAPTSTRPELSSAAMALQVEGLPPVETPCIVVDRDVMERNIDRMQQTMSSAGVALRPHAKTHKSLTIGRLQIDAGAVGLTVATIGEAEVFADGGVRDIFIAYPVWATPAKAQRLGTLHDRIRLVVGVDSVEGATQLGAQLRAQRDANRHGRVRVAVEIDSGEFRTGTSAEGAVAVASAAVSSGLDVVGVFTHGGHSYQDPAVVGAAALDEVRVLEEAASALSSAGHDVAILSAGSTPTAERSANGGVTEERPGTYVFGDRQQYHLGAVGADEIALVVAATVVSAARGRFVIDAGAKILAKDRPVFVEGFGVLPAYPGSTIARVYDHHGVVETDGEVPAVGTVVAVVPNHVCPVVNLGAGITLVSEGDVVDQWSTDTQHRF